jgi:hypothetical protein
MSDHNDKTAAACVCTPEGCLGGEFRDHQGESPGCMVCADLNPGQRCYSAPRLLTYSAASSDPRGTVSAGERYEELTDRQMAVRTVATLRERGEFDPDRPVHASLAAQEPLTAEDHLELMAAGEVLARYYRHPAMLDHAVKAGATWEQIGDARGTSAGQARQDYRDWAEGQHGLLSYKDGRFGMPDDEYTAAMTRAAEPEAYPGGIGDPANVGIQSDGRIADHADMEAGQ